MDYPGFSISIIYLEVKMVFRIVLMVLICEIFSYGNYCEAQTDGSGKMKAIGKQAPAYMRIDYGNEHFEGGRVVMDLFDTHLVVCFAEAGRSDAVTFKLSDEDYAQIASEVSSLIKEFSGKPLRRLLPGETVVMLALGTYHEGGSSFAQLPLSDLSSVDGVDLSDRISKFEKDARNAMAEKKSKEAKEDSKREEATKQRPIF